MDKNNVFIGMGNNPDGPDLPSGLGARLEREPEALETFGGMSGEQKETMIRYLQSANTGIGAESLMAEVITKLKNGQKQF